MLIDALAIIGACVVLKWIIKVFDTSGNSGQYKHWLED